MGPTGHWDLGSRMAFQILVQVRDDWKKYQALACLDAETQMEFSCYALVNYGGAVLGGAAAAVRGAKLMSSMGELSVALAKTEAEEAAHLQKALANARTIKISDGLQIKDGQLKKIGAPKPKLDASKAANDKGPIALSSMQMKATKAAAKDLDQERVQALKELRHEKDLEFIRQHAVPEGPPPNMTLDPRGFVQGGAGRFRSKAGNINLVTPAQFKELPIGTQLHNFRTGEICIVGRPQCNPNLILGPQSSNYRVGDFLIYGFKLP